MLMKLLLRSHVVPCRVSIRSSMTAYVIMLTVER